MNGSYFASQLKNVWFYVQMFCPKQEHCYDLKFSLCADVSYFLCSLRKSDYVFSQQKQVVFAHNLHTF